MRNRIHVMLMLGSLLPVVGGMGAAVGAEPLGTEEFGLTPRKLAQVIEKVEALIERCMRSQGFQYFAADYPTVRRGMNADKSVPGMSEEEFIARFGFGVSTVYTGKPPQLAQVYSPAREGLGEQNVAIFKSMSPTDQAAYNRALFGKNTEASFAVGLETENFSGTGGCTRHAIAQVFKPEQLEATYFNPRDALINKHPRMIAALRVYASEMENAGYEYAHPDEVETDIRARLDTVTVGGTTPVDKMSAVQLQALKDLQNYERRVAVKDYVLATSIIEPIEDRVEAELLASGAL